MRVVAQFDSLPRQLRALVSMSSLYYAAIAAEKKVVAGLHGGMLLLLFAELRETGTTLGVFREAGSGVE